MPAPGKTIFAGGIGVGVGVTVAVGVKVRVGVLVGVDVADGVCVAVGVNVFVGVKVGVYVKVGGTDVDVLSTSSGSSGSGVDVQGIGPPDGSKQPPCANDSLCGLIINPNKKIKMMNLKNIFVFILLIWIHFPTQCFELR